MKPLLKPVKLTQQNDTFWMIDRFYDVDNAMYILTMCNNEDDETHEFSYSTTARIADSFEVGIMDIGYAADKLTGSLRCFFNLDWITAKRQAGKILAAIAIKVANEAN